MKSNYKRITKYDYYQETSMNFIVNQVFFINTNEKEERRKKRCVIDNNDNRHSLFCKEFLVIQKIYIH